MTIEVLVVVVLMPRHIERRARRFEEAFVLPCKQVGAKDILHRIENAGMSYQLVGPALHQMDLKKVVLELLPAASKESFDAGSVVLHLFCGQNRDGGEEASLVITVPLLGRQLLEHIRCLSCAILFPALLPRQPEGLHVWGLATTYSPPIIGKLAPGKRPLMSKKMDEGKCYFWLLGPDGVRLAAQSFDFSACARIFSRRKGSAMSINPGVKLGPTILGLTRRVCV